MQRANTMKQEENKVTDGDLQNYQQKPSDLGSDESVGMNKIMRVDT